MLALAAARLHRASSFSAVPFPLIVLAAGLIGFVGARAARPHFQVGGGHGAGKARRAEREPARRGTARARAADRRRARLRVSAIWLALWLVPVIALARGARRGHTFSEIGAVLLARWPSSPSAAPMPCSPMWRSRRSSTYGWLRPGEMLDGLGMAETTPGPLIMVMQFVGFMAAYRDPGALPPMLAGTLGGLLATWVHLRAVLPVDRPRRAVHRAAARQQAAERRARRHHRGGGRRHPQPRDLVRAAHLVSRDRAGPRLRALVRCAGARRASIPGRWRSRWRRWSRSSASRPA